MSEEIKEIEIDFREMLTNLFDVTFIAPQELETLYKAGELYADAKSRIKAQGFAEWIRTNQYKYYHDTDFWISLDSLNKHTTSELYSLYLAHLETVKK